MEWQWEWEYKEAQILLALFNLLILLRIRASRTDNSLRELQPPALVSRQCLIQFVG